MNKILPFLRRFRVLIVLGVLAAAVFSYFYFRKTESPYETATVKRGNVSEEVSVTGRIKSADEVDLGFEIGGKVARASVDVGSRVVRGQLLVELDQSELAAKLNDALADLDIQKTKLDELNRGSRPEDIKIKESAANKAEQDLVNDYGGVSDILHDAYSRGDDSVRKQMDLFFSQDEELNPQLTFVTQNSQVETDAEQKRFLASQELIAWQNELSGITSVSARPLLDESLAEAENHLSFIRSFLDKTMEAVIGSVTLTQSTIDTYKANIATARSSVNTALTSVNDQKEIIASQKFTLATAQNELALAKAGSSKEEIRGQEARIKQSEAKVQLARVQLAQAALYAPFGGVVTKKDVEVGEIVSANGSVISIIGDAKFEIKADVPETDVVKLVVGQEAEISLDAIPGEKFMSRIVAINPAEKILNGVTYYEITLVFSEPLDGIKPGMTANVDILIAKHDGVLVVPARAVKEKSSGNQFVLIYDSAQKNQVLVAREIDVQTGLRGIDGNIEIISGLSEGEEVVTYQKTQ